MLELFQGCRLCLKLKAACSNPGDTLGLSIWKNVDEALLSNAASNFTILEQVQVDGAGYIFVPYAGRIKA